MAKSPYADLPEVLKTHLPAMFKTYPDLSQPHPSSWFYWTGDKVKAHNLEICHAQMVYDAAGWDEMVTAVPKNDELSLEYLRMLVRGPFRSMSDLIKLDRVGNNYFLHLLSLDKWPGNVLMNFCIASRIPIEFQFLLSPWAKRCEAGFDPTLAFLLTYSYGYNGYTEKQYDGRSFVMHRPGHMWLDPASNWTNILNGMFEGVSKPFKTHPKDSRPTNCIWGICQDYKLLLKMTDDEIAAFYTQPIQILEPPKPPPAKQPKKKPPNPYNIAMPHVFHNPGALLVNPGDVVIQQQAPIHWGVQVQPQPIEEQVIDEPDDEPFHWDNEELEDEF